MILLARPIIVLEVLVRTLDFCCIGFIKSCLQNDIASKTNHCFKSVGENIRFLLYWIHKVKNVGLLNEETE